MIGKEDCKKEVKEFIEREADLFTDMFLETFDVKDPGKKRDVFMEFFRVALTKQSEQNFKSTMELIENICSAYETLTEKEFKIYLLEISAITKQFSELTYSDIHDK